MRNIKIILLSVFCFVFNLNIQSKINNESKCLVNNEKARLILNINNELIDNTLKVIPTQTIQSKELRKLLLNYSVQNLTAVYKNRYSENGKLKPKYKYMKQCNDWFMIESINKDKAKHLVELLKMYRGISSVYVEPKYSIKPQTTTYEFTFYNQ